MLQNDLEILPTKHSYIQKLWKFLESFRQDDMSVQDYERVAAPFLLQIKNVRKKCWIIYQRQQNPKACYQSTLNLARKDHEQGFRCCACPKSNEER